MGGSYRGETNLHPFLSRHFRLPGLIGPYTRIMFRRFLFVNALLATLMVSAGCTKRSGEALKEEPESQQIVVVEAERTAASKSKTPEDVRPYDEALAWHEYKVLKVVRGYLDETTIRVAHWTVLAAKAVPADTEIGAHVTLKIRRFDGLPGMKNIAASDDLDITAEEPQRFLDMGVERPDRPRTAEEKRCDYEGTVSEQMKIYWMLRSQLRLVVMGNSHGTKGIAARLFYGDDNRRTPVALNLSPPGSNHALQSLLLREYVMPLPKLEWVVWVISPRNFNATRDESRKAKQFVASSGRRYDVAHQSSLWPAPENAPPVNFDAVSKLSNVEVDAWGSEMRSRSKLPEDPAAHRAEVLKQLSPPNFQCSESQWKEMEDTVRALNAKGIKVLLLTTPMHPLVKETKASDADGTSKEGYQMLMERLAKFDNEMPLMWFRDFNQAGNHDFLPEEFYDADHLNRAGAFKLTERVMQWMDDCVKKP
jgi:hypothetical protein